MQLCPAIDVYLYIRNPTSLPQNGGPIVEHICPLVGLLKKHHTTTYQSACEKITDQLGVRDSGLIKRIDLCLARAGRALTGGLVAARIVLAW